MPVKLFFSSFFLLIFLSNGHSQDSIIPPKRVLQSVEFSGNAFLNSNAISNQFVLAFYRGEFISNKLKEAVTKNMLSQNILGGATKIGFTYTNKPFDGNKPEFSFSFFDRQQLDLKFSKDLFYTIFYGNKRFAGETAELGNFRFDLLRYQQFRFGWNWKDDTAHISYGFAFSLLSGEQNILTKARKADLYTAPDGTYLDFDVSMTVQQSDTAKKKYFAQNGMGISADFFYEIPYTVWKNQGKILVTVEDFGFIRWNSNAMEYSADSSYHYEGVNVSDILNTSGTLLTLNADTLIDRNTDFKKIKYSTSLPFTVKVCTETKYGKQFSFEKGICFLNNSSAKPYYYFKFHFSNKQHRAALACITGYGGYGGFTSGLEAKFDFAKHYSFQVADNYLFSVNKTLSLSGMGLYTKLVRRF